jgi:S1-C subfamily serine protease
MFKRNLIAILVLCFYAITSIAQQESPKVFFDKSGKNCSEGLSYYYRQESDTSGYYRCFYTSNNKLYFKGKIKQIDNDDDNKSVFTGIGNWFYKNGNPKQTRNFNDKGIEIGTSNYYYESGKIWKEIEYDNGKVKDNTYIEYNEDGSKSKIFEDEFNNNFSEWDLYESDKSTARIADGKFELISTNKEGTSRYINHPIDGNDFTLEAIINFESNNENDKVGVIYGFKDWQNYHFFAVSKHNMYLGSFYEGVKSTNIDAMYVSALQPKQNNTLKILSNGEKIYFSVNGEIQYKDDANKLFGNNFGFITSGKAKLRVEKFAIKENNYSSTGRGNGSSGSNQPEPNDKDVKATGSGILFSTTGYIITNHHVIDNSNKFVVEINSPTGKQNYKADLIIQDKENDLAILKIHDDAFVSIPEIKYAFKENGSLDVGGTVFTIGFPHALSGMGKDAKFTDGKVSAKTGYNGSINSFQTSIPVQPGNSGGPVFNDNGQLVGVINATYREADNVSYAIKLNYIKNLIELLSDKVDLPNNTSILSLPLEEKIKVLTNYVVLVKTK